MNFLNDVPEQDRKTVELLLLDENLDVQTKLDMLRKMGLEESVIQKASEYLDPQPEEVSENEENDDIELIDFRSLLTEARQTMTNLLIQQKNWPQLRKYIAAESSEVQQAFEAFMRRVEENDSEVPREPPVKTLEPEEVSIEGVSIAGHVSEGVKRNHNDNSLKTSITSETPSVGQTPPPSSFSVQPNSLGSLKENENLKSSKTKDLENYSSADKDSLIQRERQKDAGKWAEMERQRKTEEVERLVAQRLEEEIQKRMDVEQRKAEEAASREIEARLKEENRQKELAQMERQKQQEEVERIVAQRLEEEIQKRMDVEQRKAEEAANREEERLKEENRQKELAQIERQKQQEEVERIVAQRLQEEKQKQERLAAERREAEEAASREMVERLKEENRQKELALMERQKQLEEAERLVAQRLEEEKQKQERLASERREAEEATKRERLVAQRQAELKKAKEEFYREVHEPEPVKVPEEVEPKIGILTRIPNSKVNLQFTKDFPEVMNILVLGETGVGKSTWINAFINYFKYGTMDQARANGVEVLIKTVFTQLDKDLRKYPVECNPTISGPDDQDFNEDVKTGQSSTQQPKSYAFKWGPEDDQKTINIIDTPGIGDNRGIEQDKLNFENILRFIADYEEIHAILILLKPNNSRLNVVFRFCIFELLTHLHESARKNIMFCFTNARQTLYSPGETMPALEELMQQLEKKRGIRIPLQQDNIFCFDSESFRFLTAWSKGIRFSKAEIDDFAESWNISVGETFRLLHGIKELQPHLVQKTLSVNNVRSIVFALSKPIGEILRNTEINRITLEKKIKEVEALLKEKGDLAQLDLFVDQVSIHAKELSYPMTVCAGKNCTEMRKFTNRPDDIERIVYKKQCHAHCYLTGIKKGLFPNSLIKDCWCFGCGSHPDRCQTCNCDWKTHLHISYELVFTRERVIDPKVKDSLDNNQSKQKAAEVFVLTQRKKLRDLEHLSKMLCEYCSEFAAFIHANSLLPYNDVYLEYVDFLIREEDMKISNGASGHMRTRLIEHRKIYEQTVKHLRNAAENANPNQRSSKTTEEIMNMLQELRGLPNGGQFLTEVERLEMLSVRKQQTNKVTNINMRNPHFNNRM